MDSFIFLARFCPPPYYFGDLENAQGFVDKVGESRFNKVKNRQIKKFQNLVNKKEGNITWSSNINNNLPQTVNNPNRQAGAPPSPWGRY